MSRAGDSIPAMPPRRRRFSPVRRTVFAVVAVILAWLVLEILVGAAGVHRGPAGRLYTDVYDAAYDLLPGVQVPFGNAPVPDDPTNHAGFRGPEFSDKKPAGVYRIIALGDSTTFGVLVDEPSTYPRRLETLLRAANPAVEVLNAGVPGTNIYAHRVQLERKLRPLEPDLVVLYVLFNSRPEVEAIRRMTQRGSARNRVQAVLRHSNIYRFARRVLRGGFSAAPHGQQAEITAELSGEATAPGGWVETAFARDLEAMIAQTRAGGAEPVLVYHLTLPGIEAKLAHAADPRRPLPPAEEVNERFRRLTRRICQAHDVLFIDAQPDFMEAKQAGDKLFADDVHFSAPGHELMARLLAERLAPRVTVE